MDEKTQKLNILLDRLDKLPPQLKDAMFSDLNAEKMFDIGKKHGLLIDKIGEMTNETGLLMIGITHPNEFVGNLAERLQIDRETASKIADDINREIFAPVRDHLRAMFDMTSASGAEPSPPPQTSKDVSQTALAAVGRQSTAPSKDAPLPTTTLEDLEAELERALAEEKGIQPLSIVKKPVPIEKPITPPQPTYKGVDPYREQVGEDLPNAQGKAYVPSAQNQKKEISEERSPISSFSNPVSQIQPTPMPPKQIEESSPFSPLAKQNNAEVMKAEKENSQTPPAVPKQNGALPAFRGFKMNAGGQNQITPPPQNKKDAYQEPIQ